MITAAHKALAKRMNRLPMKALMNETFLEILALLYTEEEAAIRSKAPLKPSPASKIAQCSGRRSEEIAPLLERLASQGLLAAGGREARKYFSGMHQLSGIDRLAPRFAPRMSRMIGNWIQGGMDKGIERRKGALD